MKGYFYSKSTGPFEDNKLIVEQKNYYFNGFNSFEDLHFECLDFRHEIVSNLYLKPNFDPILNNSLNLNKIEFNDYRDICFFCRLKIFFTFLKSIDLNTVWLFENIYHKQDNIDISIHDSFLKTIGKCIWNNERNGLFHNVSSLNFAHTVKYSTIDSCLFKNSSIYSINFYGLAQNFIKNNVIKFQEENQNQFKLFSCVKMVYLKYFKGFLDNQTLNPFVECLKSISFKGVLNGIKPNTFNGFKKIQEILFDVENLEDFLLDYSWASSLNSDFSIDLYNLTQINLFSNRVITIRFLLDIFLNELKDQNFCFYQKFPHSKLIFPIFRKISEKCSCSLIWLVKYNYHFFPNQRYYYWEVCSSNYSDLKNQIEKCDFPKRIFNCNKSNYNKHNTSLTILETYYKFQFLYFLIVIFTFVFGFLGLVSNLINILVTFGSTSSFKNLQNGKVIDCEMLKLMGINSIFNVFYNLIRFFHLMNVCIAQNSLFCSFISRTIFIQYFNIYIVDFIGNIFKIFSNMSLIAISLNRLFLLKGKRNFNISKLFVFIFGLLCVSILGFENILQNKITQNLYQLDDLDNYYVNYPNKNTYLLEYFLNFKPANFYQKKLSILMFIIYLGNFVLNNFVFLIIFVLIEILTIVQLKLILEKKLKTQGLDSNSSKNKYLKLKNIYHVSLYAILINTSCSILFKGIDFAISTFISINRFKNSNKDLFSFYNKIFGILEESNDLLFMISTSYLTIIYYFLNQKFRSNFSSLFKKKLIQ
ncbi:unnamed protein product [Brachionus calyciflorus]|uniref:Uncharacterized protein n=1 Tax=Brachionus calyciflorus TaxID=104777 RepID=A0A814GTP4_9BILA|nr:unnamed protein product [Brachionus calyciflorus]